MARPSASCWTGAGSLRNGTTGSIAKLASGSRRELPRSSWRDSGRPSRRPPSRPPSRRPSRFPPDLDGEDVERGRSVSPGRTLPPSHAPDSVNSAGGAIFAGADALWAASPPCRYLERLSPGRMTGSSGGALVPGWSPASSTPYSDREGVNPRGARGRSSRRSRPPRLRRPRSSVSRAAPSRRPVMRPSRDSEEERAGSSAATSATLLSLCAADSLGASSELAWSASEEVLSAEPSRSKLSAASAS